MTPMVENPRRNPGSARVRCARKGGRPRGHRGGYRFVVHGEGRATDRCLWNTVDPIGTTKSSSCRKDVVLSTIHSPYHHYNLLVRTNQKEEVGTT